MIYNEVIEYDITTDLVTEPVTLPEIKRYLNMLFDTTGSYEFTDDDTLLNDINKASRKYMEHYTGLSFGSKTITAIIRNELGDIEIPYGPIVSITSVKDADGNVLSTNQYKLIGNKFKRICWPTYSYLEITYVAGYTTLPYDLKASIITEAAWRYHNRGLEDDGMTYCKASLELASQYKRSAWLA